MTSSTTDPLLAELKRRDPERFTSLLFAPGPARQGLGLLFAFNLELAGVREKAVRETMAGHIRLQWWRDALLGETQASAFARQILSLNLPLSSLLAMVEAREADLSPDAPASLAELEAYAASTGGALHALAAQLMGGNERETDLARMAGTAYALQGLMRAIPAHASQGRRHLPFELFAGEISGPSSALNAAVETVSRRVWDHLGGIEIRRLRKSCRPAALCALQSATHLKRLRHAGYDPFDGRLSLPATRPLALLLAMI